MPTRHRHPQVHLLVGLDGVGTTTCAKRLAAELPAVRFGLDEWALRLDWNRWSRERRDRWRERAREAGHECVVHHLTAPVETPTPYEGGELRIIR